jgi:hypothetical protein
MRTYTKNGFPSIQQTSPAGKRQSQMKFKVGVDSLKPRLGQESK